MSADGRVVVVVGTGGMGLAVAKRLGAGSTLVLADCDTGALENAANELRAEGYRVIEHQTDASDESSVASLARTASELGRVEVLVHTAGVSPVQASVEAILRVDLLGTALMLDAFASTIAYGGAGVFVASMAANLFPQNLDLERRLASVPTSELLALPELAASAVPDSGTAYSLAKRANQVRVRSASLAWGQKGARVNSISPGVISTPMGAAELDGPNGAFMRQMVEASPTGRLGTPHDIASAVEFLVGPSSSFITGIDLLVDGGVVASVLTGTGNGA
jgi:NAD(P)-dependent dehydrogenase (short-subunit alcohol dehydrogenase family)